MLPQVMGSDKRGRAHVTKARASAPGLVEIF
jgi:hypothetical protein